jgi:ribosomal protein S18 acetylase RimI-like enzyme
LRVFDQGLTARTDIDIRPAERGDLDGIARVSVDTWRNTYRDLLPDTLLERLRYGYHEDRHRRFLTEADTLHRVAIEPVTGEVIGFANGGRSRQPALGLEGEIYELYIQNGFQGRGVGRALFEALQNGLDDAGRKGLIVWVLATNPNRPFYERLGGRMVSRQPIRLHGALVQEVAYGWDA